MFEISRHTLLRFAKYAVVATALIAASVALRPMELNTPHLPLGAGVEKIMDWAIVQLSPALEAIKLAISRVFSGLERLFLWFPWPVVVVATGLVGWRASSPQVGLLVGVGLLVVQLVGLWENAMSTVALVNTAMLLTIVLAIPVGVAAAKSDRFESVLRPVLDAMQTIPSLVYLIPALMLLGVGKVPAIAATLIFSVPPTIRLTSLGLRQIPPDVKEAARAFGASSLQMLVKVELPMALRTIMAGVNQSTMMSVSMVVIAAFIGAGGLGYSVLFAVDRVRIGLGVEAGLAILVIAIVLDRLTQALGKIGQPVIVRSE